MKPYDEGWLDGYDGNYVNPYAKQEDPERWLDYKTGFEHGQLAVEREDAISDLDEMGWGAEIALRDDQLAEF